MEQRVILVSDKDQAESTYGFITGTIVIAMNEEYTAIAIDPNTAYVYTNATTFPYLLEIYGDQKVTKIVSKPIEFVKRLTGGICNDCVHISNYMHKLGDSRSISNMKLEIMNQDQEKTLSFRATNIAFIMMRYKLHADAFKRQPKQTGRRRGSFFNKKRDCYLLYLTAYNDILSQNGPAQFTTLINKVKEYSYLCRISISPAFALEGLIKVGALNSDSTTTLISLPDQI